MRKVCACFILGITERSESFQVNFMQVPNSYPSRILFINFLAYYLTFRIPCSKKKIKKKHWMKSKTCLLWSTHRLKGLVIENLWLWNWSKDTKVRTKKYLSQLKEKNSREDSLEKKKSYKTILSRRYFKFRHTCTTLTILSEACLPIAESRVDL